MRESRFMGSGSIFSHCTNDKCIHKKYQFIMQSYNPDPVPITKDYCIALW